MNTKDFSIKEAIRFGWNKTKENWGFLISSWLLLVLISSTAMFITLKLLYQFNYPPFLSLLITFPISLLLGLGWVKITLDVADGLKPQWNYLYSQWRLLLKYGIAGTLFCLIVAAGGALFIIPGIIWFLKYAFFSFFIVDKQMGPIQSLQASGKITNGAKWKLGGMYLTFMGIMYGVSLILCSLFFGFSMATLNHLQINTETSQIASFVIMAGCSIISITLIAITAPTLGVITAHVYRKLDKLSQADANTVAISEQTE